ncbi:hypothetical protein ACNPON_18500 [Glutamicibacter sp. AGC13]
MSDKNNEEELAKLRAEAVIKDSMILEYQQALSDAHYKIAMLNGQLKLANLGAMDSTN